MQRYLLLFGPPGSGKSTQGAILAERLALPHISIGELLRLEAKKDSPHGKAIAAQVSKGLLVDDDTVMHLLREQLGSAIAKEEGFILDGFPRTAEQLPLWDSLVEELKLPDYLALDITLSPEESFQRLLSRGRGDDTAEVIRRRLEAYQAMAAPVLESFQERSKLLVIDGLGSVSEVASNLEFALQEQARQN